MRPLSRAAVVALALVPLGTIAGHAAGYELAGRHASFDGSHSHLRPGAWLTAVVAVAALGWIATGRGDGMRRPRLVGLAGGQAVAFLVLEAAEHVVGGHGLGHLLADPSFRWGLVAQVAVAAVLVLATAFARATGERVRALLSGRSRAVGAPPPAAASCVTAAHCGLTVVSPATERGPPRHLVPV